MYPQFPHFPHPISHNFPDYKVETNWNLRTDFAHPKSFTHDADGEGIVISIGGDYAVTSQWCISANLDFQHWSTDAGTDRTFFTKDTTADTRLNEVNWDSYAIMLGVIFVFRSVYSHAKV